jgi:hypothetical protein
VTVQDWGINAPAGRVINSETGRIVPQRIQQRRTKGWRLPLNAKSVARPSKWGNPWRVVREDCNLGGMCWAVAGPGYTTGHLDSEVVAREIAVRRFEDWIPDHWRGRRGLIAIELRGLDLACWCPLPEPGETDYCHAAVLLREANR